MISNTTVWSQSVDQNFIAAGLRARKLEQQVEDAFQAKVIEYSKDPELLAEFQKSHSAWREYLNHHLVVLNRAGASGFAPALTTTEMIEIKAGLLGFRLQQVGGAESVEVFEQGEGDQEEGDADRDDNNRTVSIDTLSEVAGIKFGVPLSKLLETKWSTYGAQVEPGGTAVMEPASKQVFEEALKTFNPVEGIKELTINFNGDREAKVFGFSIASLTVSYCASPQDTLTPAVCSVTIVSNEDGFSNQLREY